MIKLYIVGGYTLLVVMIDRTEGEEGIYRGLLSGEIKAERDFFIRKVISSYSNN